MCHVVNSYKKRADIKRVLTDEIKSICQLNKMGIFLRHNELDIIF